MKVLRFIKGRHGFWQYALWMAWVWGGLTLFCAIHPATRIAVAHGANLYALERDLHLDPELQLQRWTVDLGLVTPFYLIYIIAQGWSWWIAALAFYFRNQSAYRKLRNILVVDYVAAIVCFWLWPAAPPQFVPGSAIHSLAATATPTFYDQFATMPSIHVAFAVAIGLTARGAIPAGKRWARNLVLLWPALVILAVVGTANHFLVDALAGVALTIAAYMTVAGGWQDMRGRWSARQHRLPPVQVELELAATTAEAPSQS